MAPRSTPSATSCEGCCLPERSRICGVASFEMPLQCDPLIERGSFGLVDNYFQAASRESLIRESQGS